MTGGQEKGLRNLPKPQWALHTDGRAEREEEISAFNYLDSIKGRVETHQTPAKITAFSFCPHNIPQYSRMVLNTPKPQRGLSVLWHSTTLLKALPTTVQEPKPWNKKNQKAHTWIPRKGKALGRKVFVLSWNFTVVQQIPFPTFRC